MRVTKNTKHVTKNTKQRRLYREEEEIYQEIKVFSLLDGSTFSVLMGQRMEATVKDFQGLGHGGRGSPFQQTPGEGMYTIIYYLSHIMKG